MSTGQYRVKTECKIWKRPEEVFFHEVQINGEYLLAFDGCDNDYHDCQKCEECRKEAYRVLTQVGENP